MPYQQVSRPQEEKKASIIICTYNSRKTIRGVLNSIFASPCRNFEVLIIDDASTDDTVEICREFPLEVVELEENKGPAVARNIGVKHAHTEIIIFMDSDITFPPGMISGMLGYMEAEPDIAGVFTVTSPVPLNPNFYSKFFARQEHQNIMQYFREEKETVYGSFICTRCGAIKKKVFEETGGFNEIYSKPSIEDYDFSMRMDKKYKILYAKNLLNNHCYPDTFSKIFRRYYKNSKELMCIKYHRKVSEGNPFKGDSYARLMILTAFFSGMGGGISGHFLLLSLISFSVAAVIKLSLLKVFYKNEGAYFACRGWAFYCLCSFPIFAGAAAGIKDRAIYSLIKR